MLVRPESDSPVRIGIMRCGELGVVENLQAGAVQSVAAAVAVAARRLPVGGQWPNGYSRNEIDALFALLCHVCYAMLCCDIHTLSTSVNVNYGVVDIRFDMQSASEDVETETVRERTEMQAPHPIHPFIEQ